MTDTVFSYDAQRVAGLLRMVFRSLQQRILYFKSYLHSPILPIANNMAKQIFVFEFLPGLNRLFPGFNNTWPDLVMKSPYPDIVVSVTISFVSGPVTAWIVNKNYPEKRGAIRAIEKTRNAMELLFVECMTKQTLIEIALQGDEVYVGLINVQNIDPQRQFLIMLPFVSGYKDSKQKVRFTTYYDSVYRGVEEINSDFRIVIPMSELRNARPYDVRAYENFGTRNN